MTKELSPKSTANLGSKFQCGCTNLVSLFITLRVFCTDYSNQARTCFSPSSVKFVFLLLFFVFVAFIAD